MSLRTISECGGIHEPERNTSQSQTQSARGIRLSELLAICLQPNGKREPSIDILLKLSKLYSVSVDYLIGNDEVIDTSITEKEAAMISAMRQADERARQDAIALLELHTGNKKI